MPIYSNFYQTLTTACPIVELRGYAAAQLLANCNSRAALAIFSGRASIV